VLLAAWEAARLRHPPGALRARIERALSLDAATLPAPLRARLGVALADVLRSHASPQPGVDAASAALAQADSPALQARALAMRAVVHQEHGALDSALEDHHKALERARSVDAQRILGIIHSNLGNLLMRRGQLQAARDHLSTAVSCFDALALRRLAAIARFNLGTVWHDLGELETAEDWYHEALREHRALGNLRYVALAEGNLGSLALDRGRPADLDEAAERLQLAEPMHVRVGNLRSAGIVRLTAAELARLRGRSGEAKAQLAHARRFGQSTGSRLLARAVDALQAELEAPARPEAAGQRVARAIDRLDEMGASIEAAIARCRQGRIAVASGDTALARTCLETAEATRRQQSVQQRSELGRHIRELEALLEAVEP
jgi:tetratricopeptide (TPR) repeat protein